MAYNPLVGVDLDLGHRIVHEVEAKGISVPVAFWAKLAEYGEWRFFLASPDFDRMGLFEAYSSIAQAGRGEDVYDRPVITILDMNDPIVRGLQQRLRLDLPIRGLHLTGQVSGARSMEEGILERVA